MDDSSPLVGKAHPATRTSAGAPLRDPLPMELHVPAAPSRPGESASYALVAAQSGDLPRPDTLAPFRELRDHATGLIRVLADDDAASGPWVPAIGGQQLRSGLEMMLRARHFDARMMTMQRQGRIS